LWSLEWLLQKQLEALKEQKRGLMQKLLTGGQGESLKAPAVARKLWPGREGSRLKDEGTDHE
jgi:hypothetical protein